MHSHIEHLSPRLKLTCVVLNGAQYIGRNVINDLIVTVHITRRIV